MIKNIIYILFLISINCFGQFNTPLLHTKIGAGEYGAQTTQFLDRLSGLTLVQEKSIDSIITMAQDSGVWDLAEAMYAFNLDSETNSRQNWKSSSFTLQLTGADYIYTAGEFIEFTHSTSTYYNTQYIPSDERNIDSMTVMFQIHDFNTAVSLFFTGVQGSSGTNSRTFFAINNAGVDQANIFSSNSSYNDYIVMDTVIAVTRLNTTVDQYKDGSETFSNTISKGALPDVPIHIHGYNNNGNHAAGNMPTIKYMIYGTYMTDTEIRKWTNILNYATKSLRNAF